MSIEENLETGTALNSSSSKGELQDLAWNKKELLKRIEMLLETRVLGVFRTEFSTPSEVTDVQYQRFEQFIRYFKTGIATLLQKVDVATKRTDVNEDMIFGAVREGITGFQMDIRKFIENVVEKDNGQILDALKKAGQEVEKIFDLTDLEEDRMLEKIVDFPSGLSLDAAQFVRIKQNIRPEVKISFKEKMTVKKNKSEIKNESSSIPFKYKWTDEELFANDKLPKFYFFKKSPSEIVALWERTKKDLEEKYLEWADKCKFKLPNHPPLQHLRLFQKNIKVLETTFLRAYKDTDNVCVVPAILKGHDNTAQTFYDFFDSRLNWEIHGPEPSFAKELVEGFLQEMRKGESINYKGYFSQNLLTEEMYYVSWEQDKKKKTKESFIIYNEMLHRISRGKFLMSKAVMETAITNFCIDQISDFNKAKAYAVIEEIIIKIKENCTSSLEGIDNASEYVGIFKKEIHIALQIIQDFETNEISPEILEICKNALSFQISRNCKQSVLTTVYFLELEIDEKFQESLLNLFPQDGEIIQKPSTKQEEVITAEKSFWAITAEEAIERSKKIPNFKYQWTNEELFSKNKLPAVFLLSHSYNEINVLWEQTEVDLWKGFYDWKKECLNLQKGGRIMTDKGDIMNLEQGFILLESEFKRALSEYQEMVSTLFSGGFWGTLKEEESSITKNLEILCDIDHHPKPKFLANIIEKFFQVAKQSNPQQYLTLSQDLVSEEKIWSTYPQQAQTIGISKNLIIKQFIDYRDDRTVGEFRENIFKDFARIYGKKPKGEFASSLIEAISQLQKNIENALEELLPETSLCNNQFEYILLWKKILKEILIVISKFENKNLSDQNLAELKNFCSFSFSENATESVLRISLKYFLHEEDIFRVQSELRNFFPENIDTISSLETSKFTFENFQNWLSGVKINLVNNLKIESNNPDLNFYLKLKHAFERQLGEIKIEKKEIGTNGEIKTMDELAQLSANLRLKIEEVPNTIIIDGFEYQLPAECKGLLLKEVNVMVSEICPLQKWDTENVHALSSSLYDLEKESIKKNETEESEISENIELADASFGKDEMLSIYGIDKNKLSESFAHRLKDHLASDLEGVLLSASTSLDGEKINVLGKQLRSAMDSLSEKIQSTEIQEVDVERMKILIRESLESAVVMDGLDPVIREAVKKSMQKRIAAVDIVTNEEQLLEFIMERGTNGLQKFEATLEIIGSAKDQERVKQENIQIEKYEIDALNDLKDLRDQLEKLSTQAISQSGTERSNAIEELRHLSTYLRTIREMYIVKNLQSSDE